VRGDVTIVNLNNGLNPGDGEIARTKRRFTEIMKAQILALLFLLFVTMGEVRDSRNNLVETWGTQGDNIEVRDSRNNLLRTYRDQGDSIEVRDSRNNLLYRYQKKH